MAKLSAPMQDALLAMSGKILALPPVNGRTLAALKSRGLATREMVGAWQLTGDGEAEAARIRAERDAAIEATAGKCQPVCPAYPCDKPGDCIKHDADATQIERDFAALPLIEGYRWQWFNPQGGLPESRDCIQLMYVDDRSLSPAALLRRNVDGTWRAERGAAWGMSGGIAGTYQDSFSMLLCAGAIAAEADERGMLTTWAQLQDEAKAAADADERMLMEECERIRHEACDDLDRHIMSIAGRPAVVGKLCKIKRSSAGQRAKWRKVR